MIDPITAVSFSVFESKGTYALLLGSGISRAAHIPTGWEITLDLVRRLALLEGVSEQVNWADWYHQKFNKEPTYSDLLSLVATTGDQRRAILHSYIEPTALDLKDGRKVPTKAHKAIARLVRDGFIRVIVTTNFDRLLENSLRELGIEPTVIKSNDDLKGAVPLTHARCYVVKLHGDYLDTRIKNTESELRSYSKSFNLVLDRIFEEFGLIICGWSADWDDALRAAILRAPNRRYPTFWATRGNVTAIAQDLIQNRNARKIEIESADAFFEALQRNVETQTTLQGQDPRSIELLIGNAKRFIGRPEDRIQLEDIIAQEARYLVSILNSDEFDPDGAWSTERFLRTVGRYEVLSEPATRLFGVLGRWGSGSEFKVAADVIRSLASSQSRSGLIVLNKLRTYPARLLLFGYGLGLLKAERYEDLFRLMNCSIRPIHGNETTFVESLVAWEGDNNDNWNLVEPLPEHKRLTALSDHLHRLFSDWLSDYLVFQGAEFTKLFENFELLGALAYTGLSGDEAQLNELMKGSFDKNYVWAPIGRASWDGETRKAVFEEWRREDVSRQLIAAGFARRSASYLELAIKSIENLSDRLRW